MAILNQARAHKPIPLDDMIEKLDKETTELLNPKK